MHPQISKSEVLILFQWHIPWLRADVLTALPLQTSIFRGLDKSCSGLKPYQEGTQQRNLFFKYYFLKYKKLVFDYLKKKFGFSLLFIFILNNVRIILC